MAAAGVAAALESGQIGIGIGMRLGERVAHDGETCTR
jgi:hypothetical protein